ncbi:hypothetical protein Acr_05g0015240 [Actinidia rufa]|uniref:Uncharacterized protein n=1 Tax=Actinidia rufa TaxID=165716 RepID=A0A7J0EN10_9ERIC|nr:hypothetical protein Acr_05g0015240 [Actinidia rufa]
MTVPMVSRKVWNSDLAALDDGDGDDNAMFPPHEIVARGSANLPKMTFSVLEGVGRKLKGTYLVYSFSQVYSLSLTRARTHNP